MELENGGSPSLDTVFSLIVVGLAGGVLNSIKEASQINGRLDWSIVVERTTNFP